MEDSLKSKSTGTVFPHQLHIWAGDLSPEHPNAAKRKFWKQHWPSVFLLCSDSQAKLSRSQAWSHDCKPRCHMYLLQVASPCSIPWVSLFKFWRFSVDGLYLWRDHQSGKGINDHLWDHDERTFSLDVDGLAMALTNYPWPCFCLQMLGLQVSITWPDKLHILKSVHEWHLKKWARMRRL